MKFKFKIQPYQTAAVAAVVDCFNGQPRQQGVSYRIDPGVQAPQPIEAVNEGAFAGFKNSDLVLGPVSMLANIQAVQQRQNLFVSARLGVRDPKAAPRKKGVRWPSLSRNTEICYVNLDVEMETGTGKTYCYIKTMYELHKQYGWSKFIVVVPSIAIREGVYSSFDTTAEHFQELYGHRIKAFIYNSSRLHEIESFSSGIGINVMVINIQAFNARGEAQRRIYDVRDDFQSRKPIDVISANRPIVILDEPQKMEGESTLERLGEFKPLMILRYSATHRTQHNKVYCLDAVDAYNQKLVKKISVCGITVKGLGGTNAYLYLKGIEVSKQSPVAKIELDVKLKGGAIKRTTKSLQFGASLYDETNLDVYKNLRIDDVNARENFVEIGGNRLSVGQASGNIDESFLRRIQIRETIREHIAKERELYSKGIKVLSLFFIDKVALYRDYAQEDNQGEYARIFEEEYASLKGEMLQSLAFDEDKSYREYLSGIVTRSTHSGYFSIDKKTGNLQDPKVASRGDEKGQSTDSDAYDLILKDKVRLLSFDEPVRFIFSHSALREGWDNPNVFVMCMLKQSDNVTTRRQEVGRGLRLAVDKSGSRMDSPQTIHDINRLTVIANESYTDFVTALQREIMQELPDRPQFASAKYFANTVDERTARLIEDYLVQEKYVDVDRYILPKYHADKKADSLAPLPTELVSQREQVFALIDSVFSEVALPEIEDVNQERTNRRNEEMFHKKEFQELWNRINKKAVYHVAFDSGDLVSRCAKALDGNLHVASLQYTLHRGTQEAGMTRTILDSRAAFHHESSEQIGEAPSVRSTVSYDLLGKIVGLTQLTRKTVAAILGKMSPEKFGLFKNNPEQFIAEASRIIKEQMAGTVVDGLTYGEISETPTAEIFTVSQKIRSESRFTGKLQKHVYDFAETDSDVEKKFAVAMDIDKDVIVYAKLPRGFSIPTPLGDEGYHPDWAIAFREGSVKHVYFVAETKGVVSEQERRPIEEQKINCARKFFERLNAAFADKQIRYDVVDSFETLMKIVKK